jgi:acetyl esterase/lipase
LHLVDPDLFDYLALAQIADISDENIGAARTIVMELITSRLENLNENSVILREQLMIPGRGDQPDLRAVIHRPTKPSATPRPAYFHVHGGGYVMGSPEMTQDRNRVVAEESDCHVITPAYRIAPETVFPGAIEDCYTALLHIYHHASGLGIDPNRIVIGGESAGGGLAAALCLLVRDRGEVPLAGQYLIYPMLDDRTGMDVTRNEFAGEFGWTPANNRYGWSSILGDAYGTDRVSQYAAPARATDLSSLPPTFIAVGALDLFVDECLEYSQRLIRAGVPTELRVYPGAYHAFDLAGDTRIVRAFYRDCREALGNMLAIPNRK